MERVGIREMRQNLSRYAQRVQDGESFVLTDRGVEIARLVPPADRTTAVDRLVAERGARRATVAVDALAPPVLAPPGAPTIAQALAAERAERYS